MRSITRLGACYLVLTLQVFALFPLAACLYRDHGPKVGTQQPLLQLLQPDRLGVHHAQLFARAPILGLGEERVVMLNVWLKRVSSAGLAQQEGGGSGGEQQEGEMGEAAEASSSSLYLLPTQTDGIEGFAWADDLSNLTSHKYEKMMMTVDVQAWTPRLRLQVWGSDLEILPVFIPPRKSPASSPHVPPISNLLAFSFTFRLDSLPGARDMECFKVYEDSLPGNKAPFCLPISSRELCQRLAPDKIFTPSQPALWGVMIPFRSYGITGANWEQYIDHVIQRLQYYMPYWLSTGATGLLLYVDRFSGHILGRFPEVQRMLLNGTLMFVDWDRIERLRYNFDQALVYSHAFLGLSSCGSNLWVQIADVDELLYFPKGAQWPGMFDCLRRTTAISSEAAVIKAPRYDIIASEHGVERETELWYSPPPAGAGWKHPLELYDKISTVPHPIIIGKYFACPAYRISSVWMHCASPVRGGTWHEIDGSCVFFLHLANYWRPRVNASSGNLTNFRLHNNASLLLSSLL